jgi:hypothetical protein
VKGLRRITAGALAAAGAAIFASGAFAAPPGARGHVYVDDNTAGTNTIAAFDRLADGSLVPTPGSPFTTGGAGTGGSLASQGAIQITDDGRYVLAVDAGSNTISSLRIKPDGGLQLADVEPSGGVLPVSIAVHGGLVYVANAGTGGSDYTGITVNAGGQLAPIPGSTVPLPDDAQPGDVFFSPDGSKLVGTRVNTSLIDSFVVGADGRLTAAPGSPFAAQGVGPFGSEFRPTSSVQLFVSNAHNGGTNGTISALADAADGTLTSIGASPYPDLQAAPCWVEISHDGRYLFAVNTASTSVSRFEIAADGSLTLLGSTPFSQTAGIGATDARLSADGSTLYVLESAAGALAAFSVDGGSLTALAGLTAALPVGAAPSGVATV